MVCPSVGIRRFVRGIDAQTSGLAICRVRDPADLRGFPAPRHSRSFGKRSVLLSGPVVLVVGLMHTQEVWPFVVRAKWSVLLSHLAESLSFCPDPSLQSFVRSSHQRPRKRSGHLSLIG
jgi:hypothetical protein